MRILSPDTHPAPSGPTGSSPQLSLIHILIINKSLFGERKYPDNVEVIGVDAMGISADLQNTRGANLVMMGAMIAATGMMDQKQFSDTLKDYFEHKGKPSEKNVQCFEMGCEKAEKIS